MDSRFFKTPEKSTVDIGESAKSKQEMLDLVEEDLVEWVDPFMSIDTLYGTFDVDIRHISLIFAAKENNLNKWFFDFMIQGQLLTLHFNSKEQAESARAQIVKTLRLFS